MLPTKYKPFLKVTLLFVFLFTICGTSISQPKVRIMLTHPPLNQLTLKDMYTCKVENLTDETIIVHLEGFMKEANAGDIVSGLTGEFELKGKEKKTFNTGNVPKGGEYKWTNNKFKKVMLQTGGAPEGVYTICLKVIADMGVVVGQENCIEQKIEITSETQITLLGPDTSGNDELELSQPIIFIWAAPNLKGPYTLKIVEIEKSQSIDEAMLKNRAFIQKEGITTTTFLYQPGEKKFEAGTRYGWKVMCGKVESEVRSFVYPCQAGVVDYCSGGQIMTFTPTGGTCCFDIMINTNTTPWFNAVGVFPLGGTSISNTANVSSYSHTSNTTQAVWERTGYGNSFPANQNIQLGQICFNSSSNFQVEIRWSTSGGWCWNCTTTVNLNCGPVCDSAVACFTMKDTVCLNDCFVIDASCSQNETDYFLSVQESDISWNRYGVEQMEWFSGTAPGSIDIKAWYLSKGAQFECDKYYRVKLAVKNSCTPWAEFTKLLYVECCNKDSCSDFEDGGFGGWQVDNAFKQIMPSGGNPGQYLETQDWIDGSYFFNNNPYMGYLGDSLCPNTCVSFCFDINYIYNGLGNTYNNIITTLEPRITIEGNGFSAYFSFAPITVGDGWHTCCAPIGYINPGAPLPSNSLGQWVMSTGTNNNWNSLLSNVSKISLPVDPSSDMFEKIGYDNICIKDNCAPPDTTGNSCIEVLKDSVWCLDKSGTDQNYGFKLWINNPGTMCPTFIVSPNIVLSGIMLSGFVTNNVPSGPSVITGSFTDYAPVNNPFCMRLKCVKPGWDTCSKVYCFPLPTCTEAINNCPKFEASTFSIKCHTLFSTNNYDFKIAVTNHESTSGYISLTSMTPGMTLNSYSPTSANPHTSALVSGNVTGSGTTLCIKVTFSVSHGQSCDTIICFTLPRCGLQHGNNDTIIMHHIDTTLMHTQFFIGQEYGGGIIFYIDGTGQHGLIAASSDQECNLLNWGNYDYSTTSIGATATGIGSGQTNTAAIIAIYGTGNYAASFCDQLILNGYSDWYLPGADELNLLLLQKNVVGGFNCWNEFYWSSSEILSSGWGWTGGYLRGFTILLPDMNWYPTYPTAQMNVRAIRQF